VGTAGTLAAGQEGYLVFTTPMTPGSYFFWCDVGTHRFQGMAGVLDVTAGGGTGSTGGNQPGMPSTGAQDGYSLELKDYLLALLAVALLAGGARLLRKGSQ
jgi:hypothetical protein